MSDIVDSLLSLALELLPLDSRPNLSTLVALAHTFVELEPQIYQRALANTLTMGDLHRVRTHALVSTLSPVPLTEQSLPDGQLCFAVRAVALILRLRAKAVQHEWDSNDDGSEE